MNNTVEVIFRKDKSCAVVNVFNNDDFVMGARAREVNEDNVFSEVLYQAALRIDQLELQLDKMTAHSIKLTSVAMGSGASQALRDAIDAGPELNHADVMKTLKGMADRATNGDPGGILAAELKVVELAAHQYNLVRELTSCQFVLHSLAHEGQVAPDYARDAKAVLDCTPKASLADVRASAIEQAANDLATHCVVGSNVGYVDLDEFRNYAEAIRSNNQ